MEFFGEDAVVAGDVGLGWWTPIQGKMGGAASGVGMVWRMMETVMVVPHHYGALYLILASLDSLHRGCRSTFRCSE